jgi:hypothetical protein
MNGSLETDLREMPKERISVVTRPSPLPTVVSRFLVASGCVLWLLWLVGSRDSTPFLECPLPLEDSVVQVEISQVAEFASQNANGCLSVELSGILEMR